MSLGRFGIWGVWGVWFLLVLRVLGFDSFPPFRFLVLRIFGVFRFFSLLGIRFCGVSLSGFSDFLRYGAARFWFLGVCAVWGFRGVRLKWCCGLFTGGHYYKTT